MYYILFIQISFLCIFFHHKSDTRCFHLEVHQSQTSCDLWMLGVKSTQGIERVKTSLNMSLIYRQ